MSIKLLIAMVVLTGLSVLAIFVVPHHEYPEHSFKPRTLWEIVKPVFAGDLPHRANAIMALFAFLLLGTFAAVYPIMFVPIMRSSLAVEQAAGASPYTHRSWLIVGGVVAMIGTAINMLAILVSEMSFGFGASSASANRTFGCVAIPLFQAMVSLLSIIIGASPTVARLVAQNY